jgi:hypothetical protein
MSLANEWANGEDSIANLEAIAVHRTMTLMLKTSFSLGHSGCDKKGVEAATEIWIQQTW